MEMFMLWIIDTFMLWRPLANTIQDDLALSYSRGHEPSLHVKWP